MTTVSVFPSCGKALVIITVLSWFCDLRLVQHRGKPAVLLERHGTRCARDQTGLKICVVGQLRRARRDWTRGRGWPTAAELTGAGERGSSWRADPALRVRY